VPRVGAKRKNATPRLLLSTTVVSAYMVVQGGVEAGLGEGEKAEEPEVSVREKRATETGEDCLELSAVAVIKYSAPTPPYTASDTESTVSSSVEKA